MGAPPLGLPQPVAHATDRANERAFFPKLLAKAHDVHIDGAAFHFKRRIPYRLHDLIAGQDDSLIQQEITEQVEFFERQLDLLSVCCDDMLLLIHDDMTVREQLLIRLRRFFGSSKDRTDP